MERGLDHFFAPQPMQGMVIARVGLGLLLFFSYLSKFPYVQALYGPAGIGGYDLHQRMPGVDPGRVLEASLHVLHRVSSPELIWLLYAVLLLASLCFAVGAFTRAAGLTALLLHTLFHARNYHAYLGWGVMLKPFLFFVLMSPVGRFGSVDAWRRRTRDPLIPVEEWVGPAWPVRLVQMQICTLYAVAGWSRLDDPGWANGDMLLVALDGRNSGRFDFDWFVMADWLRPLSYGAFALEPLAPFLLWVRKIRPWMVLGLMAMHVALEIFSDVDWWQYMMIPLLTVFLPTEWLTRALRLPGSLVRQLKALRVSA